MRSKQYLADEQFGIRVNNAVKLSKVNKETLPRPTPHTITSNDVYQVPGMHLAQHSKTRYCVSPLHNGVSNVYLHSITGGSNRH